MSGWICVAYFIYRQLRARRALLQFKDVPLSTRRALLLYKVYSDSALLVLNGTFLVCNNALLALNWQCAGLLPILSTYPLQVFLYICKCTYHHLRARRALPLFKEASVENQKGSITIDTVQRQRPSGSPWNIFWMLIVPFWLSTDIY